MSRQKYDSFENEEVSDRSPPSVSIRTDKIEVLGSTTIVQYTPSLSCDARFQLLLALAQICLEVISSTLDWVVYGTADAHDVGSSVKAFLTFSIIGMFILVAQIVYMVLFYRWGKDIRLDIVSLVTVSFKILPQVAIIFFIEAVQRTDIHSSAQIVKVIHALIDVTARITILTMFLYRQYKRDEKKALEKHSTIMPMYGLHLVMALIILTLAIIIFANN